MQVNNQGEHAGTMTSLDLNSLESHQVQNRSQEYVPKILPLTTGSEPLNGIDTFTVENEISINSSYQHDQPTNDFQAGSNVASFTGASSNLGAASVFPEYSGFTSYQSSDSYGYGNAGYTGYYNNYSKQSNLSYSQPVGAHQNTGASYQTLSSFQNTGSYPGPTSYSSTYYDPDYQTSEAYQSSSYSNQTNSWNGHCGNYTSHQYPNYTPDTSSAYSSDSASAASLQYQQDYNKQWVDYYSQKEVICAPGTEVSCAPGTEVNCAPGTENLFVTSNGQIITSISNLTCPVPGTTNGYLSSSAQPWQPGNPSWKQESILAQLPTLQADTVFYGSNDGYQKPVSLGLPNNHVISSQSHFQNPLGSKSTHDNFQDQQRSACPQGLNFHYSTHQGPYVQYPAPQGSNMQHPATHQLPHNYKTSTHTISSVNTRKVGTLQIQTNPKIASNFPLGLRKPDKDNYTTSTAATPAYISVSVLKQNDKLSQEANGSIQKPAVFPPSLRGYVERALARCKDDPQMEASQAIMKEIITKATNDGTLSTRDWDTEPLFPVPNLDLVNKDAIQPKYKRSPSRRVKSRWEPVVEDKFIDKSMPINHGTVKSLNWFQNNKVERKLSGGNAHNRGNGLNNSRFIISEEKAPNKSSPRPVKKQCLGEDGDASSESDKESSMMSFSSSAMTLANSPDERKKRERRSKRFDKSQGSRLEINNQFRPKSVGAGSLHSRTNASMLSKSVEDVNNRTVEDIDWDSLTVKGTCQEIEKRYLRLTSAPDPTTVRPEEVLEKALRMVQISEKNYLYKCDQLKSIRQDLTVQRIHNELTVKVYETHARLAVEVGDLPEYNQCQSQLKTLYAEGIEGCLMEFAAYNLLRVITHSNNNRDILSSMSRLSDKAKKDEAVKHALAVRAAYASGNYVKFFRLYKTAPNMNACLMDLYVEKVRYTAVGCMSRSYRPSIPIQYIAQTLGFISISTTPGPSEGKDNNRLLECVEWLKAHGACLIGENIGEMELDTKASSSSLFMPEPEDAVAHGDSTLAVNDFLTRSS